MTTAILGPGLLLILILILSGVLGLAVGSFLNVVVHRVPLGLSVVRPASRCPECDHAIRRRHNVPVMSWVALRGRCADCRAPISARYPALELLTSLVFVAVTARLIQLDLISAAPAFLWFTALGIALAVIDLQTGRLPNALVLPAYPVLAVLLTAAALLAGEPEALIRVAIGGIGSYLLFYAIAMARPGGMGFGDVKTAGLVGGMLGFISYPVLLVGIGAGFLLACVVGLLAMSLHRASRTTAVPFGPFMVVGAVASLFVGGQVAQAYQTLLLT